MSVSSGPRDFIVAVLQTIDPAAHLADFADAPDDRYSIRVQIGGGISKFLVVPRSLVDQASTDGEAHRALKRILQTELRLLRSGLHLADSTEVLAGARRVNAGLPADDQDPGQRVLVGQVAEVDHARRIVTIGGREFRVLEDIALVTVTSGQSVRALYEERDGEPWIVELAVTPAGFR